MRVSLQYQVHVIVDSKGGICSVVRDDLSDTIQMWGETSSGQMEYFESEAYHVEEWADSNGFDYYYFDKSEIVDCLKQ